MERLPHDVRLLIGHLQPRARGDVVREYQSRGFAVEEAAFPNVLRHKALSERPDVVICPPGWLGQDDRRALRWQGTGLVEVDVQEEQPVHLVGLVDAAVRQLGSRMSPPPPSGDRPATPPISRADTPGGAFAPGDTRPGVGPMDTRPGLGGFDTRPRARAIAPRATPPPPPAGAPSPSSIAEITGGHRKAVDTGPRVSPELRASLGIPAPEPRAVEPKRAKKRREKEDAKAADAARPKSVIVAVGLVVAALIVILFQCSSV